MQHPIRAPLQPTPCSPAGKCGRTSTRTWIPHEGCSSRHSRMFGRSAGQRVVPLQDMHHWAALPRSRSVSPRMAAVFSTEMRLMPCCLHLTLHCIAVHPPFRSESVLLLPFKETHLEDLQGLAPSRTALSSLDAPVLAGYIEPH